MFVKNINFDVEKLIITSFFKNYVLLIVVVAH